VSSGTLSWTELREWAADLCFNSDSPKGCSLSLAAFVYHLQLLAKKVLQRCTSVDKCVQRFTLAKARCSVSPAVREFLSLRKPVESKALVAELDKLVGKHGPTFTATATPDKPVESPGRQQYRRPAPYMCFNCMKPGHRIADC